MTLIEKFRQIKKFPDFLFFLPAKIIFLLRYVMRHEIVDPHKYIGAKKAPAVILIWHNRLLFFPGSNPASSRGFNPVYRNGNLHDENNSSRTAILLSLAQGSEKAAA